MLEFWQFPSLPYQLCICFCFGFLICSVVMYTQHTHTNLYVLHGRRGEYGAGVMINTHTLSMLLEIYRSLQKLERNLLSARRHVDISYK